MHKIGGAHLQCVNNHYVKYEYKGMDTVGVTDYTNYAPPKHFGWKNCLSPTPLKNEKKIMKRAQNRRCTSSICVQSLGKVWIKRNENFWSYRLHKLGTPKVLRTDGPTTRPAFAKATQVKRVKIDRFCFRSYFNRIPSLLLRKPLASSRLFFSDLYHVSGSSFENGSLKCLILPTKIQSKATLEF